MSSILHATENARHMSLPRVLETSFIGGGEAIMVCAVALWQKIKCLKSAKS